MKKSNIVFSKMVNELQVYCTKVDKTTRPKILHSKDAIEIIREIFNSDIRMMDKMDYVEFAIALFLGNDNQFLGYQFLSQGGTNGTFMQPRLIFQGMLLANASGVILCHNHPSGNLKPSKEDLKTLNLIIDGAELLGIKVPDSYIITSDGFTSYATEGLL